METKSYSDRFSYGLTFLIFGILFFLDKTGLLIKIPYGNKLISVGAFFLIAGIVFIFTQPKRILSWVFLGVGIFLNSDIFFGWISEYSRYLVPLALIIVGIFMVFSAKKK